MLVYEKCLNNIEIESDAAQTNRIAKAKIKIQDSITGYKDQIS